MKFVKIAAVGAVLVGSCLVSATGNATVLFNNLGASSDGFDPASTTIPAAVGPLFGSFSTGGSAVLTGISLRLDATDPADGGTFTIGLFNDSSTSPGSEIGSSTFSDSTLTTSPTVVSWAPSFSLGADTRFWIGLSTTGSANWFFSTDISGPGVAGEFFANSTGVFPNSDGGPYQMELTTSSSSVVPEPSTWAMMLLGFLGIALAGYRTSRKNVAVA